MKDIHKSAHIFTVATLFFKFKKLSLNLNINYIRTSFAQKYSI